MCEDTGILPEDEYRKILQKVYLSEESASYYINSNSRYQPFSCDNKPVRTTYRKCCGTRWSGVRTVNGYSYVRYRYLKDELATLEVAFTYDVPDLKKIVITDPEANSITFQADILPTLVGAAYSTTRGIIYERTKDTGLVNYPVPMVSIDTLMLKNGLSLAE